MANITFTHNYTKLWGQNLAMLIGCSEMEREQMHPDLIEYDTKYGNGLYYPLKKGRYIQLVYLGNKGIPFTTIRPFTSDKMAYYRRSIGQFFNVIVAEDTVNEQRTDIPKSDSSSSDAIDGSGANREGATAGEIFPSSR